MGRQAHSDATTSWPCRRSTQKARRAAHGRGAGWAYYEIAHALESRYTSCAARGKRHAEAPPHARRWAYEASHTPRRTAAPHNATLAASAGCIWTRSVLTISIRNLGARAGRSRKVDMRHHLVHRFTVRLPARMRRSRAAECDASARHSRGMTASETARQVWAGLVSTVRSRTAGMGSNELHPNPRLLNHESDSQFILLLTPSEQFYFKSRKNLNSSDGSRSTRSQAFIAHRYPSSEAPTPTHGTCVPPSRPFAQRQIDSPTMERTTRSIITDFGSDERIDMVLA
ncbi:hypothetical protein HYPSUDRAFT_199042 [Hypholoma sublateritium FD-334 SS-4]|uniref:Uncharacterized protein n=1 Tax=Hypholoma sublateritium (strain FD-334 SS-4) TaxID=945553 RepID=A0A0D2Q3V2_HYPSF|nr:hypothetical protein HYPSUDRAFT_199042 [Hypholoma sublateritium FD-334 SS-4]